MMGCYQTDGVGVLPGGGQQNLPRETPYREQGANPHVTASLWRQELGSDFIAVLVAS